MNEKQKDFVEEYLSNKHNATLAYQKAYPNGSKSTAEVNGSRLLSNAKIQEYIQSKKEETAKRNNKTKDDLLNVLSKIMDSDTAKDTDKIKAVDSYAKMAGYNEPDKVINHISTNTNLKDLFDFGDE